MYNCRKCLEQLYPFLDRELNQDEQAEVREHLNRCGRCRTRFRFEGNMLQAVGEVARSTNCPDETRRRILRACGREVAP